MNENLDFSEKQKEFLRGLLSETFLPLERKVKTRKSNLVFSKGCFQYPFLTTYIIAYLRNKKQAKSQ